jgi:hypothetical protein
MLLLTIRAAFGGFVGKRELLLMAPFWELAATVIGEVCTPEDAMVVVLIAVSEPPTFPIVKVTSSLIASKDCYCLLRLFNFLVLELRVRE